ncbi:MAG TPA: family 43 glycosylhydrolase [Flavisolibacter sp.]|nr:family 43 glycosylhydrolase [Flavisolibacter sp.]
MKEKRIGPEPAQKTILHSPNGAPYSFAIEISNADSNTTDMRTFHIQGKDPATGKNKTGLYYLKNNEHHDYLDLFAQLAGDFGLQLPYNRQPVANRAFTAHYRKVIGQNIAPGILYGYGDPAVIRVDDTPDGTKYYMVVTSNDAPDSFPLLRSPNLTDWECIGYVFPQDRKPPWASSGLGISDYWAPEMHQVGNEFRIYFVARDKHANDLCIGVARSSSPEGPFQPDAAPLLTNNVIDPHLFVAGTAETYLFWKEDNNEVWPGRLINFLYHHPHLIPALFPATAHQATASLILTLWPWAQALSPMERFLVLQIFIEAVSTDFAAFRQLLSSIMETLPTPLHQEINTILELMKTRVYAQLLSADGSQLIGERTLIIENDLDWEAHLVEGMWVTKYGQQYYLFYAGNDFSTDKYGIGVAIADNLLGPYRKMPAPLLYSTSEWRAPGHPSLVIRPDGKPELFLHAYYPGKAGYKQFRALLAIPITLKEDLVDL